MKKGTVTKTPAVKAPKITLGSSKEITAQAKSLSNKRGLFRSSERSKYLKGQQTLAKGKAQIWASNLRGAISDTAAQIGTNRTIREVEAGKQATRRNEIDAALAKWQAQINMDSSNAGQNQSGSTTDIPSSGLGG